MSARPWFPFYPADYLLDTDGLSPEQHGVYLLILLRSWRSPIPADLDKIKSILPPMHGLTFNRLVPPILERFFMIQDGFYLNKRMEKERRKSRELSEKQVRNAKKRWGHSRNNNDLSDANAMPLQSQSQLHLRKKEDKDAANAATSRYFFETGIIRLNERDFKKWEQAYPMLDLRAELLSLEVWAGEQGKNWFHAVPAALTKRQRQIKIELEQAKRTDKNSLYTTALF